MAVGLFAATWAALVGLEHLPPGPPGVGFAGMNDLLTACAALAAVVLGTLAMAQSRAGSGCEPVTSASAWPLSSTARSCSTAASSTPWDAGPRARQVLGYFPAATLVAVFGLVAGSVSGRSKPATRWSWMACIELVVILAALTAVLQLTPTVARALTMVALPDPATPAASRVSCCWPRPGRRWPLRLPAPGGCRGPAGGATWPSPVVALGLVQGRLALVLAPSGASIWVLGSHLFQLVGFAMAFVVVAAELDQRATTERGQLLDSLVAARTDGARRLARQTIEAGHGHDIRSALFAIDGAAQTLVDRFDVLGEADRVALARMVGAGVDRLRLLVEVRMEEIEDFGVDTVVRSVVYSEKRLGVSVTTALPAGLRGVGRAADLAVVLQTLIRSPRIRSATVPWSCGAPARGVRCCSWSRPMAWAPTR